MKRILLIIGILCMLPAAMQAQDWGYVPLGGGSSSSGITVGDLTDSLNANPRGIFDRNGNTVFVKNGGFDSLDFKIDNTGKVTANTMVSKVFLAVTDTIRFTDGSDSIDCASASTFYCTLGRNDTLYIKGMTGTATQSQTVNIRIRNANAYTLTWDPQIEWPGTAPTLTAVANKSDIYTLIKENGVIRGNYSQGYNR